MSYGVIASRSCQVIVEATQLDHERDLSEPLDRFLDLWGGVWVPGRLTLTRLHVNFIPHRAGRGLAMLDLRLTDVRSVELSGGRVSKVMAFRTPTHLMHVRMLGAEAFAHKVADLVEASRQT